MPKPETDYAGGTDFLSLAAGAILTMPLAKGVAAAVRNPKRLVDENHTGLSPCEAVSRT